MSIALFLKGSCTVSVPAVHRTAAMNLCMQMGLQYTRFAWREDGSVQFSCTASSARRFVAACRSRDIEAEILAHWGLPKLAMRLGKRAGLVVGGVLAVALIILSGLFVWDVQVSGNETLTEGEVIEELRACGFGVGSYLPALRVREIENRVLMAKIHLHPKSLPTWLPHETGKLNTLSFTAAMLRYRLGRRSKKGSFWWAVCMTAKRGAFATHAPQGA